MSDWAAVDSLIACPGRRIAGQECRLLVFLCLGWILQGTPILSCNIITRDDCGMVVEVDDAGAHTANAPVVIFELL